MRFGALGGGAGGGGGAAGGGAADALATALTGWIGGPESALATTGDAARGTRDSVNAAGTGSNWLTASGSRAVEGWSFFF